MQRAVSVSSGDVKTEAAKNVGGKPFSLPHSFGKYLLFDEIGAGGMARIYLSEAKTQLGAGKLVVIKQIHPELSLKEKFSKMFIEEAKLSAQLSHPNIVQVFGLGSEESRLFIAMEYVEGFDLNILLRKISKAKIALPLDFALLMIQEVLKGLEYAHHSLDDKGEPLQIVHRDLSPSNVLISFEGEVKLCDFGIAKAMRKAASEDEDDLVGFRVAGKSAYMAPEHARGEAVDTRADLFAVGILLWELCAGRRMYRGSEKEMLAQAQKAEVPSFPDRKIPHLTKLKEMLNKALHPSKEERFQTASDFGQELEKFVREAGLVASPLKFSEFLKSNFGEEIKAREEKLAQALVEVKEFEELDLEELEEVEINEEEELVSRIQSIAPDDSLDLLEQRISIPPHKRIDKKSIRALASNPQFWKYVAIVGWVFVVGIGSYWVLG